jgi:hypothetical protein
MLRTDILQEICKSLRFILVVVRRLLYLCNLAQGALVFGLRSLRVALGFGKLASKFL